MDSRGDRDNTQEKRGVNEVVRGWVGYFYYGNCTKAMSALRYYLSYRMRVYMRRKHHFNSLGYKAYPNSYYYKSLGLYQVPSIAPWVKSVKADRKSTRLN